MSARELERVRQDLEIEGYEPGSPDFEFLLLERRVQLCQVLHRAPQCGGCPHYDACTLVKDYLTQLRYGRPKTAVNP